MVIMNLKKKEWSYSYEEELSKSKKCCSHCKTTETPLWRGGPAGPKTLCNACGIRYRKRRALNSSMGMNKGHEKKRERQENSTNDDSAKTVDDVVGGSNLSNSLKVKLLGLGDEVLFQHSTSIVKKPRTMLGEEEQAAVCLMALSCGFVFA